MTDQTDQPSTLDILSECERLGISVWLFHRKTDNRYDVELSHIDEARGTEMKVSCVADGIFTALQAAWDARNNFGLET